MSDTGNNAPSQSNTPSKPNPAQSTRSYMYLESAGSMMYEKDGRWVLEKVPPYLFGQKKKTSDEDADENGGQLDPALVIIDTLTSNETVPCNLCDNKDCVKNGGNDIAPLWVWMYNMISQIAGKVKDYKRDMEQRDVSCGENYREPGVTVDQALVSSKGTQQSSVNMRGKK